MTRSTMGGVYGDPDGNEFEIMWMLPAGQIALKPVGSEHDQRLRHTVTVWYGSVARLRR